MAVEDIVGNRCRRSFLLPVHTGHIAGMGCGGHCMFQGIFQVPVQDSLPYSRRHTAFRNIGRIDFLIMELRDMITYSIQQAGPSDCRVALFLWACHSGAKLKLKDLAHPGNHIGLLLQDATQKGCVFMPYQHYCRTGSTGIRRLADPKELPGKISDRFLSDGKVGPCGFGKNHPRCAPVFFPKTLPYRKRPL